MNSISSYRVDMETRKCYSRSELFRLAKSMKNEPAFELQLDKFEANSARLANELNAVTKLRSLSNLGRQRSELDARFTSLRDFDKSVPLQPRFSRMTSSPMIRYGRAAGAQQQALSGQADVSAQVQEKHAQLIESLVENNSPLLKAKEQAAARRPVEPQLDQSDCLATRTTRLFGALKRDSIRTHSRRKSDEPTSMPFALSACESKLNMAKWAAGCTNSHLVARCDQSSSPIFRINSSERLANTRASSADGEDDFDITSLLSITVLSDIKTIRPNENLVERNNLKQQMTKNLRVLSRARTSTDFSLSTRRRDLSLDHSDSHPSSGPLSLIDSGWSQSNPRSTQEMAPRAAPATSKQVDESVAHIIAAFKAQVKARASQPAPSPVCEVASREPTSSESTSDQARAEAPPLSCERAADQTEEPESSSIKEQAKPVMRFSNIPRLIRVRTPDQGQKVSACSTASTVQSTLAERVPLRRSDKILPRSSVSRYRQVGSKSQAKEAP